MRAILLPSAQRMDHVSWNFSQNHYTVLFEESQNSKIRSILQVTLSLSHMWFFIILACGLITLQKRGYPFPGIFQTPHQRGLQCWYQSSNHWSFYSSSARKSCKAGLALQLRLVAACVGSVTLSEEERSKWSRPHKIQESSGHLETISKKIELWFCRHIKDPLAWYCLLYPESCGAHLEVAPQRYLWFLIRICLD